MKIFRKILQTVKFVNALTQGVYCGLNEFKRLYFTEKEINEIIQENNLNLKEDGIQ